MHELAKACGTWLLDRISAPADATTVDVPYSSVSQGALVVRGSTASPRPA
jgi:hypothetical protein